MEQGIAQALLDINAVKFDADQPVVFKSGIKSPIYVDNRRLIYHPQQWKLVIQGFQHIIAQHQIEFDIIAGVETAGIPHSSVLAYTLQCPSVFVRKTAKTHGQKKQIEGGDIYDKRVMLIEDLITTGASSLASVNSLREEGAHVTHCLAIISYGFPEAVAGFQKANVHLHTLTTFAMILDTASNTLHTADVNTISDWLRDPHGWAERHNKI